MSVFVVMLLGGLWHGAGWGFIVWGMLHGILLIIERMLRNHVPPVIRTNRLMRVLMALATFLVVSIAWVFFRAPNLHVAMTVFERLYVDRLAEITVYDLGLGPLSVYVIVAALVLYHLCAGRYTYAALARRLPWWLKGGFLAFLFLGLTLLSRGDRSAFIYFQF